MNFDYKSYGGETSNRDVDPWGLVFLRDVWYLVGYCHLRDASRTFRLDRVSALGLRPERFRPKEGFDARAYLLDSMPNIPGRWDIAIRVEMTLDEALKRFPPGIGTLSETTAGLIYECRMDSLRPVARFLIGLEVPFTVLRPEALRNEIKAIGEKIARMAERR